MSLAIVGDVGCRPYDTALPHARCVARWTRAKKNDVDEQNEKCRKCDAGMLRKVEAKQAERTAQEDTKMYPPGSEHAGGILAARVYVQQLTAELAGEELEIEEPPKKRGPASPMPIAKPSTVVEEPMKECSKCAREFIRLHESGLCLKCRRAGAKKTKAPMVKPQGGGRRRSKPVSLPRPARDDGERPVLVTYLELHADVDAMKARHEEELTAKADELEQFVAENPDVVDQARAVLERITKRERKAA